MKIGFLIKKIDEDFVNFLGLIKDFEFVIIEIFFQNSESFLKENVKCVKTMNFEKAIQENEIKFLFVEKEIDFKSKITTNIKIIDNELERHIFDYNFYAVRNKKTQNSIYFPYFIDFDFFSSYYNKLKKYDKIPRITILTNTFDIVLTDLLERLLEIKKDIKNLNIIVYQAATEKLIPYVNFVSKELNKKERAELYLNSNLLIAVENRKKEILEAMAMKKIVLTNDGFLGLPKIDFRNLTKKIERLIGLEEYEANQLIAKEFDIENAAKTFEKELREFIEIYV